MRKLILAAILVASAGTAAAQQANGTGQATSGSQSGANVYTGVNFGASDAANRVATTPPVYTAPSMFGQGTCGQSNTFGASITGFGIGGSSASDDPYCNARSDAQAAVFLGLAEVAKVRLFCFGADANRMAYEAAGNVCPEGSTAKSLAQAKAEQRRQPGYMP